MDDTQTLSSVLREYQENWPEFDRPETRVMLSLIRLNDLVLESTRAAVAMHGLTMAGFETLMTLRSQPAPWQMTPTALFRAILVTSGGMTKILKKLEKDGYIQRTENPDDQRSRYVRLTAKGKVFAEVVMESIAEHDRRILDQSLNDQQINQLAKVLLRTVNKIERA